MYCSSCGSLNSDDGRFCIQCGLSLRGSQAPQRQSQPPISRLRRILKRCGHCIRLPGGTVCLIDCFGLRILQQRRRPVPWDSKSSTVRFRIAPDYRSNANAYSSYSQCSGSGNKKRTKFIGTSITRTDLSKSRESSAPLPKMEATMMSNSEPKIPSPMLSVK